MTTIDTVILGGGLTGLSTAYYLERQGYFDYAIFEQEPAAGGLCRSVKQDGFIFDYTGHLLHATDESAIQFINHALGLNNCNYIARKSFIYSHGALTRYPFQVNLHGLPTDTIVECIEGFLTRKKRTGTSFHRWVLNHFGPGLAKHFFFPYQEKLFCYPVKRLSASWTGRFVPATSLRQMIQGAITAPSDQAIGYNAHFYYPTAGGIQHLIDGTVKQLLNPITVNHRATHIDLAQRVIRFANGNSVQFNRLVNTIPLNQLTNIIKDTPITTFKRAHRHLIANAVLNVNVGINRPDWPDMHWIYVPEMQYPYYRLGFPHNLAQAMAPQQHSSIALECAYRGNPATNMQTHAIEQLKRMLSITDTELATINYLTLPCAYVIYNQWRDKHLESLLARLKENGIYSVGRYGAWKYASMQEAILDGEATAHELILHARRPLLGARHRPSQTQVV